MATKTDKIILGLELLGYTKIEHASIRDCYTKIRTTKTGKKAQHYVWVKTGTLRAGFSHKITDAISAPMLTQKCVWRAEGNEQITAD